MKIKAVIFDMDGIIMNTEPLQMKAFNKIMAKYRIFVTPEFFKTLVGISSAENFKNLKKLFGLPEDWQFLLEQKNIAYRKILKEEIKIKGKNALNPGIYEFLKFLKERNIPIALASSSSFDDISIILDGLNIRKFFTVITSGQEVKKSKPQPDIFLLTAKRLNIEPEYCLVIEDSYPGLVAAKKANMKCIAIPNEYTYGFDYSSSDFVLNSTEDLLSLKNKIDFVKNQPVGV